MSELSVSPDPAKLDAARRLLAAGIRMYFGREDELAVQVLASAAISLLRELGASQAEDLDPALGAVGNLPLLMVAHSAWIELRNESLWPEGAVLWVYYNAVTGAKEEVQEDLREFVDALERLAPDQRQRFCAGWIEKAKQAETADGSTVH